MSHSDRQSSSEDTARTVSSVGCHSTDVIGFSCHWKLAMGPAAVFRVSQILKPPSSAPVTRSSPTKGLQLRTFTSLPCASEIVTAAFLRFCSLVSHTHTLWSALQEANTVSQPVPCRFHCTSSIDPLCPTNGLSDCTLQPPGTGSQRKISPSFAPDKNLPMVCGLKSRAKPSCLCAALVKMGFGLGRAFPRGLSRALRWASKFHMWTLPESAQVATTWPACGMALILLTAPGCGTPFDSSRASCSSLSSSLSLSSASSSSSRPSLEVLYSFDHFITKIRLSSARWACVPATM
mmetsp:Transcript_70145/g.197943  ORF Transcript_70145/g.197943 Transcript_70145/m.197943 type:complete len:292 (+) Transcript_70145:293-1168(+)